MVNEDSVGRENDAERILVYNIGVSIQDVTFATEIYQMLAKNGVIDHYIILILI